MRRELSSESNSANLPTTQEDIWIERKQAEEEEEEYEMGFLIADFLEANSTNYGIRREKEGKCFLVFTHTQENLKTQTRF